MSNHPTVQPSQRCGRSLAVPARTPKTLSSGAIMRRLIPLLFSIRRTRPWTAGPDQRTDYHGRHRLQGIVVICSLLQEPPSTLLYSTSAPSVVRYYYITSLSI
jgi:hypothetical protein